ncbi:MAG: hypothetical protein ABFS35_18830 [Bacteroidota bacterium]
MVITLKEILIVDLYNSIENNDPSIIDKDLKYEDFEDLVDEYMELQKGDLTIIELRKKSIEDRIKITAACLLYLERNLMDEEIMQVLRDNKWKIDKDNYPFDIENIAKGLEKLRNKANRLDPEKKKKKKIDKAVSIYDILASMSSNLDGVYLDPRIVVVPEFISYRKALDRKAEQYEKLKAK